MDFLKKHYEKMILAGLLLLFIGSMLYLLNAIKESHTRLNIREKRADYSCADEKSPGFDVKYITEGNCDWHQSEAKLKGKNQVSDLVLMFPVTRCGNRQCDSLIPRSVLEAAEKTPDDSDSFKCPVCKDPQKKPNAPFNPGEDIVSNIIKRDDLDGDGIPNDVEKRFGLDPINKDDALMSLARDGFSNIYKYKNDFVLNDPQSHPPLYKRLLVASAGRSKIPYTLKAITPNGANEKEWEIQINDHLNGKDSKTIFKRLGDSVNLRFDGKSHNYRISDVKYIKQGENDESTITLTPIFGNDVTLVMKAGQTLYSPNSKVTLFDTGSGSEFEVKKGNSFRLGNSRIGRSTYRVVNIDPTRKEVFLADEDGAPIAEPLTTRGFIPVRERIYSSPADAGNGTVK